MYECEQIFEMKECAEAIVSSCSREASQVMLSILGFRDESFDLWLMQTQGLRLEDLPRTKAMKHLCDFHGIDIGQLKAEAINFLSSYNPDLQIPMT